MICLDISDRMCAAFGADAVAVAVANGILACRGFSLSKFNIFQKYYLAFFFFVISESLGGIFFVFPIGQSQKDFL